MDAYTLHRPVFSKLILWIILVLVELFLAWTNVLFPYYVVPISLALLLLGTLFIFPELAYFLFILSFGNHLLHLQINFAHSAPRLERLAEIPVDIVVLRTPATAFLALLTLLTWILARMAKTSAPYPKTPLDLPLSLFFIWFLISLIWTPDWIPAAIVILMLFCCYIGFYLSLTIIRTKRILEITIGLFIVLGLINSAVVAYSLHGEPVWSEIYRSENISFYFNFIHMARQRGMGLLFSPMTAYFLNIPIMLSLAMLFEKKGFTKRLILGLIIVFFLYALLATLPKGGLLGLFTGSLFMALAYKPVRRHFIIFFSILLVILMGLSFLVYFTWPWPERGGLFMGRESAGVRALIWQNGFEDLLKSYGFGYGCGAFYPAHSIFFQVLFELGLPGFFLFMWILFRLFCAVRSSLSMKSLDPYYGRMILGFSAAMISLLTIGLTDGYYFEDNLWILLGVGMAILNLANRSSPVKPHPEEARMPV
jgi:hypothetical protein